MKIVTSYQPDTNITHNPSSFCWKHSHKPQAPSRIPRISEFLIYYIQWMQSHILLTVEMIDFTTAFLVRLKNCLLKRDDRESLRGVRTVGFQYTLRRWNPVNWWGFLHLKDLLVFSSFYYKTWNSQGRDTSQIHMQRQQVSVIWEKQNWIHWNFVT